MLATMIGLTYLGTACCYVASPSSGPSPLGVEDVLLRWGRSGGLLLLVLGLGTAVASHPVGEGLLVWGAIAMASCSVLVIVAPLLDRFVTASGTLALALTVLGLFL